MNSKSSTICFLVQEDKDKVLLGMKKRGFGEGKWNGFGGKPEAGESIEAAAKREIFEEAKIEVDQKDLEKVALIDFFEDGDLVFHSHVFLIKKWLGKPKESEEMKPRWFGFSEIPYKDMWSADKEWIPLVLSGIKLKATIDFKPGMDKVESFKYSEVLNF